MSVGLHSFIPRQLKRELTLSLREVPVTGLLGPRQCGKSTLARHLLADWPEESVHLDLERPSDARRLNDPELFLSQQRDRLVCLDEVQLRPDLFPVLRTVADDRSLNVTLLILGSASPELLRHHGVTELATANTKDFADFGFDRVWNPLL